MNRVLSSLVVLSLGALLLTGCTAASGATTACTPKGGSVTICVNGTPIDFSKEKVTPHMHENGNLYAPVVPLANALGVEIHVDANAKSVMVNGKNVEALSSDQMKGIHVHGDAVFVPLKQFAAAAGLKLDLNADKGTAGFAK